jgi:mono/diheme cytochrome c family protein
MTPVRFVGMRTMRILVLAGAVVVATSIGAACGSGDDVATPSDPTLARGQQVYRQNCASCHGSRGGGGAGVRLAGVVAERYPNIDDQITVIAEGQAGMPSFEDRLSPEDIAAVAAYVRTL